MNPFPRRPEPSFWGEYERRWLYEAGPRVDPLHDWQRLGRTLAQWFHDEVRPPGEARNCAYCDGPLGAESPATIDHFIPKSRCRALGLSWENLYPACSLCNTQAKRTSGSCLLLRPDLEPVGSWVDFNPRTARLEPAPELTERVCRVRVERTLRVLRLNTTTRVGIRRRAYRDLQNAWALGDLERVVHAATDGPYRFIARKFLASKKAFGVLV